MNKNTLIIGAVGLAAAAYLYLGGGLSMGVSGGGGGGTDAGEVVTSKKDDTTGGGDGTTFIFPADTFTGFPAAGGGISLDDLLKLLTPPPITGGDTGTKKEEAVGTGSSNAPSVAKLGGGGFGGNPITNLFTALSGKEYYAVDGQTVAYDKKTAVAELWGTGTSTIMRFLGGSIDLNTARPAFIPSSGGSDALTAFAARSGGPSGGALAKTEGASPLNKKDEGMAINSGAGTGAYTLVDPIYSIGGQSIVSAARVYNIPSSGIGTVTASGNIVVPQSGTGKGAGVVLLSSSGQFLAGGSAGATTAALERTAGMEAASQAASRAASIASGYFVNSKGGLQKGSSSSGVKK